MEPRMEMIVAVDRNWAIGNKNQLLVSIPQDQKLFREETMGHVLVMGRRTFEGLPGGRALDGRETYVLSRRKGYQAKGALVVHSEEELIGTLREQEKADRKIFVAGGGEIYRMLLPYTDVVHITRIWKAYEADTYFPNLEKEPGWELTAESDEQTYFDLEYGFYRYERVGVH